MILTQPCGIFFIGSRIFDGIFEWIPRFCKDFHSKLMFSCQVQILRKMVSKTIAGARQNIRWRKTSGQILTINKYRKNVLSIFIYIHIYVCIYIYIY